MSFFDRFHLVSTRSSGASLAAAAILLSVVLGLNVARTIQKLNVPGKPDMRKWALQDFRDALYYPTVAMLEGNNPYDVAAYEAAYPVGQMFPLYSPLTFLVHLPFALFSFPIAEWIYFVAVAAGTMLLVALSLRFCNERVTATLLLIFTALVLASKPGHVNLAVGQVTVQAVLGCYLALHFARTRTWLSAAGLALASLKPTYAVPLVLLMLCRRDFRAVFLGLLLSLLAAIPTGLVVLANTGWESFLAAIPGNVHAFDSDPNVAAETAWLRFDSYVVVARLLGRDPGSLASVLIPLAVLGLAGGALWKSGRSHHNDSHHNEGADSLSGVLICLAVITSVHHQIYDGLMLVLPIAALLAARHCSWRRVPRAVRLALLGLLMVPCWNWLPERRWFDFTTNRLLWNLAASVTGLSLLAALGICVYLCFRSSSGQQCASAAPDCS